MFGAVLNSSLIRVIPIGMALLALQQTMFVEMKPFGVIIQLLLAFAASAGAAGGPERGAITGFVLGLMFDLAVGSPLGSSSITMGLAGYIAGSPLFGRVAEGDAVLTAGGSDSLSPPNIPIGRVANVIPGVGVGGLQLEVDMNADLDRLNFVTVILYTAPREASAIQ
jgi:hypothetical protein